MSMKKVSRTKVGDVGETSIDRICPDKNKFGWSKKPEVGRKDSLTRLLRDSYEQDDSDNGDITIEVGGCSFRCHMLLLQSYSEFFRQRSRHERRIVLEDEQVSPEVFGAIYAWMRSREKRVERKGLVRLLMGADYLQVALLVRQCWDLVQNQNWFREQEALLLYLEARECHHETIQRLMMQQIGRVFLTLVSALDFVSMEACEVVRLLTLDNLGVCSEIDVFYSAVRWLLHDWDTRKPHLCKVMGCVRLGLIDSTRIVMLRRNDNTAQLGELLSDEWLQNSLEHALNYAIFREKFEISDPFYFRSFLARFNYPQLFERVLLNDPYWETHDKKEIYLYDDFVAHLRVIRANALTYWSTLEMKAKSQ